MTKETNVGQPSISDQNEKGQKGYNITTRKISLFVISQESVKQQHTPTPSLEQGQKPKKKQSRRAKQPIPTPSLEQGQEPTEQQPIPTPSLEQGQEPTEQQPSDQKEEDQTTGMSRRDFLVCLALAGIACVTGVGIGRVLGDLVGDLSKQEQTPQGQDNKPQQGLTGKTETPTSGATKGTTKKPTEKPEEKQEATKTLSPLEQAKQNWYEIWPKTPEQAAKLFGGRPDQWQVNPDWNGKQVPNRYGVDYTTYEWRPSNPNDLPVPWPKTLEEAVKWFFPESSPEQQQAILPYIKPAWRNPKTGLVEGWHLSEDHWMKTGIPDLPIYIHRGEVGEGYTVNGTQEADDDRAWLVFGGFGLNNQEGPIEIIRLKLQYGQGATIWMPGTDPQKIGLAQSVFSNSHYGEGKLGPDSYGFNPVYPCPQNSSNN